MFNLIDNYTLKLQRFDQGKNEHSSIKNKDSLPLSKFYKTAKKS